MHCKSYNMINNFINTSIYVHISSKSRIFVRLVACYWNQANWTIYSMLYTRDFSFVLQQLLINHLS